LNDPYESTNLLEGSLDAAQRTAYNSLTYKLAGYQEALSQPVIADTTRQGDLFTLTVTGESNLIYTLWQTASLDTPEWAPVTNAIVASNSPTEKRLTDPAATSEHQFYRVLGAAP
jgi:hypothetical protein